MSDYQITIENKQEQIQINKDLKEPLLKLNLTPFNEKKEPLRFRVPCTNKTTHQ